MKKLLSALERNENERKADDFKQFCINVAADLLVDGMEEDAKQRLRDDMK